MNRRIFKNYIVVCKQELRPMSFEWYSQSKSSGQFCYAETEIARRPFALAVYTLQEANRLIQISEEFRFKNNYEETGYLLMPVTLNHDPQKNNVAGGILKFKRNVRRDH